MVEAEQQWSIILSPEGASLVRGARNNCCPLLHPAVSDKTDTLSPWVLAVIIMAGGMILVVAVLGCAIIRRKKSDKWVLMTARE